MNVGHEYYEIIHVHGLGYTKYRSRVSNFLKINFKAQVLYQKKHSNERQGKHKKKEFIFRLSDDEKLAQC